MEHPIDPTPVEQFARQTGFKPEQVIADIREGLRYGELRDDQWFVLPKPGYPPTPRVSPAIAPPGPRFVGELLMAVAVLGFAAIALGVFLDAWQDTRFRGEYTLLLILAAGGGSVAWAVGRHLVRSG